MRPSHLFCSLVYLLRHSLSVTPQVGYLSFLKLGPKLLKWVPGQKAADLRTWLTAYAYWNQVRAEIDREALLMPHTAKRGVEAVSSTLLLAELSFRAIVGAISVKDILSLCVQHTGSRCHEIPLFMA